MMKRLHGRVACVGLEWRVGIGCVCGCGSVAMQDWNGQGVAC